MEEGRKDRLQTVATDRAERSAEAGTGNPGDAGTGAGFGDLRGAGRRGAWPWARTTLRGDFQERTL